MTDLMNKSGLNRVPRLFTAIVIAPMLLAVVYFVFIAADRYESSSKILVKSSASTEHEGIKVGSFTLGDSDAKEDAMIVREFIWSNDMVNDIKKEFDLKKLYNNSGSDVISSLGNNASQEELLKFWKKKVDIDFDETSYILTIKTQGYDRETARKLNEAILRLSEDKINWMTNRVAMEQSKSVEKELEYIKKVMLDAQLALIEFQGTHQTINPIEQAKALMAVQADIEGKKAELETQLKHKSSYLADDSFQIKDLKGKISAMSSQIITEKAKVIGDGKLNKSAEEFMKLMLDVQFTNKMYETAMSALEKSKFEAAQKAKSIITIQQPSTPDEATLPRHAYDLSLILTALLVIYGIAKMATKIIKEHRG